MNKLPDEIVNKLPDEIEKEIHMFSMFADGVPQSAIQYIYNLLEEENCWDLGDNLHLHIRFFDSEPDADSDGEVDWDSHYSEREMKTFLKLVGGAGGGACLFYAIYCADAEHLQHVLVEVKKAINDYKQRGLCEDCGFHLKVKDCACCLKCCITRAVLP